MTYDDIKMYLDIAEILSTRSHCVKSKRASLVIKGNNIVGIGINGTPTGNLNCDQVFNHLSNIEEHKEFSRKNEIESEMNAIIRAKNCEDSIMVTLIEPDVEIIKYLYISGIRKIYYRYSNDKNSGVLNRMCNELNITISQII